MLNQTSKIRDTFLSIYTNGLDRIHFLDIGAHVDWMIHKLEHHPQSYPFITTWHQSLYQFLDLGELSFSDFTQQISGLLNIDTVDSNKGFLDALEPHSKSDQLAESLVQTHLSLFQSEKVSDEFWSLIREESNRHLQFLEQAIQTKSQVILNEYISWVFNFYTSKAVPFGEVFRYFISYRLVVQHSYLKEGIGILDEALHQLIQKNSDQVQQTEDITSHAKTYLDYLLNGLRKEATSFIMNLADNGMPLKDIYIQIFQASQYEIGLLWENNKVTIAQEHYCTATTQMIMSMLYPRIFSTMDNGLKVVTACVGNELHEMGIRMVSDFLEMDGWDTYYLGANTPKEAILEALVEYKADLLAISVTLTPQIKDASEIIQLIKKERPEVKIMVGGYPFILDPELYQRIGADAAVNSATEVHEKALSLLS